jgi:type II secretory pathway component PulJ
MKNSRAGFLLLETLVAILIATIVLTVLARVLAGVWLDNRRPMERISALNVARHVAARLTLQTAAFTGHGRVGSFSYDTVIAPLAIEPRESQLAPMPAGAAIQARSEKPGSAAELQRLSIDVRSTSGRRFTLETIRIDKPE